MNSPIRKPTGFTFLAICIGGASCYGISHGHKEAPHLPESAFPPSLPTTSTITNNIAVTSNIQIAHTQYPELDTTLIEYPDSASAFWGSFRRQSESI